MTAPLTGILLAAGRGRRFGGNKVTARLNDGKPIGLAAAATLASCVDHMLVVIDEIDGDTDRMFSAAGYVTVFAADAGNGMAHSLARGVRASADSSAWLIALADMPFIKRSTVATLAEALREGAAIVVPRHAGRQGHPVGFRASFRDELLGLHGDRGAREIVEKNPAQVVYCDCEDAGITCDIDTPADLAAIFG